MVELFIRFTNPFYVCHDWSDLPVTMNFITADCNRCGTLQSREIKLHHASCDGVVRTIPKNVVGMKVDPAAIPNRYATGYGAKIPTEYMVQYDTGQPSSLWRRVYMMQYGNSGSAYILIHTRVVFLDHNTESRLESLR